MEANGQSCRLLLSLLLSLAPLLASSASAEWYVGGQLGGTITEDLGSVRVVGGGARISDLALDNSFTFGAKAGYFLEKHKWLGVETDLYTTNPHLQGQTATLTTSGGSTPVSIVGTLNRVTTWAFSVMARYPGERFQPYAGMGLGLNFAKATGAFARDTDTSPGFHLVGGARWFMTKEVALFGEYKYDRATFRFQDTGLVGDYLGHTLVVGASYHFY